MTKNLLSNKDFKIERIKLNNHFIRVASPKKTISDNEFERFARKIVKNLK